MAGRGFCVKIRLDLHAITCPGVWLCPNGKVALRITTLGSTLESHRVSPIFPLLYHDQFTFKKTFTRVAALTELQRNLEQEFLYAELIQWITPCSNRGVILATFETNLADLLYPVPCYKGLLAGVDVDLLMEPTKHFPGIIVPKIEISTKTVIEEVLGVWNTSVDGAYIVNPKTINSKHTPCVHRKRPVKGIIRQRRVCHSQGKSRSQVCQAGSTRYQYESSNVENFCQNEQHPIDKCYHATKEKTKCLCDSDFKRKNHEIPAACSDTHIFDNCPVCLKYKCYFSGRCEKSNTEKSLSNRRKENVLKDDESLECIDHLYGDHRCCTCKPDSPISHEPISILRSKAQYLQEAKEKLYCTERDWKTADVSECNRCCTRDQNQAKQGFYKNLERFYKRMYKQAKLRAQEAND